MAAGARSQLDSLFQGPVGNGSVTAGNQSAKAIREGCDFGRRPVPAESVHERGCESVAGTHGIDDVYPVYGRFDVMPVGEYGAPAISQRDPYGLPPVAGRPFAAECFDVQREPRELMNPLEFRLVELHHIGTLQ